MEKVYMGGILQTKKHYGGMLAPKGGGNLKFEAKGLETVRRDQCALTKKVLRRSLEIYLGSRDKRELRSYLERVWRKVLMGKVPVSDFIITGRVRSSYREGGETMAAYLVRRLVQARTRSTTEAELTPELTSAFDARFDSETGFKSPTP